MAEAIISPNVFINETDNTAISQGPIVAGAAIVGPTVNGIPYVPTVVTSFSEYAAKFGISFINGSSGSTEYFTSLAARNYFENGGRSLLVTRITNQGTGSALQQFSSASVPKLGTSSSLPSSASFILETLSWGSHMNNAGGTSVSGALPSGSNLNVRWEVTQVNPTLGTFTLLVRSGNDNENQKNILEVWPNLSMDREQPNFISRVIGDSYQTYSSAENYIQVNGNFPNQSRYVYVSEVNSPTPFYFESKFDFF
jgi:hypothetical protein